MKVIYKFKGSLDIFVYWFTGGNTVSRVVFKDYVMRKHKLDECFLDLEIHPKPSDPDQIPAYSRIIVRRLPLTECVLQK